MIRVWGPGAAGRRRLAIVEEVWKLLERAQVISNGVEELQRNKPSTVYEKNREEIRSAYLNWYDEARILVSDQLAPRLEQHYHDRAGEPRIERFWSDPVGLIEAGASGDFEEDPNERTWIYPQENTFQRPLRAQINVLRLHQWRHRRGFLGEAWATHVSPIDHGLRQAMSNTARGGWTLANINDHFLSTGALEEWWIEPLNSNSSARATQVHGWIEGIGLWAPVQELEMVTDVAKAMLSNMAPGDYKTALDTALNRVQRRTTGPQPKVGNLGPFRLPPGYEYLEPDCRDFLAAHPNYEHNVFLMMRFGSEEPIVELVNTIRTTLAEYGLHVHRADDRTFSQRRDMWDNVCIYMLCCRHGIAILEDHYVHEFNANVALEYGFMVALNKQPLLLKDRGFNHLKADIMGKLYNSFDIAQAQTSLKGPLVSWLGDIGVSKLSNAVESSAKS